MIKTTLKGFFKNFKYAFMTAGIVYLALLLALFGLVNGIVMICGENVKLLFNDVLLLLSDYVSTFSFSSIQSAPALLSDILAAVDLHVSQFAGALMALLISMITLVLILSAVAKSFTVIYINNEKAKNNPFGTFIAIVFRTIVTVLFATLIVALFDVWKLSIIIFFILYVLLASVLNMVMVKFARGKSVPFKKLISIKNLLKLEVCYLLAFVFSIAFTLLIAAALGFILAILIFIPVTIYLFACVEAASYEFFRLPATIYKGKTTISNEDKTAKDSANSNQSNPKTVTPEKKNRSRKKQ